MRSSIPPSRRTPQMPEFCDLCLPKIITCFSSELGLAMLEKCINHFRKDFLSMQPLSVQ